MGWVGERSAEGAALGLSLLLGTLQQHFIVVHCGLLEAHSHVSKSSLNE